MIKYNATNDKKLFETPFGISLWNFLNSKEILIRMETATKLSKPALEAIDELLLQEFGDEIKNFEARKSCGKMVKQIMEHNGYSFEKDGVKFKNNILFSRASRYKKKS